MRLLFLSLFLLAAYPAHSQERSALPDTVDIYVANRSFRYTARVVETEIRALAESHAYLDNSWPADHPGILVTGDLFLRIDGHPFTLYVHPERHHTDVRLESRRLVLPPAIQRKAEAFLRELATRLQ